MKYTLVDSNLHECLKTGIIKELNSLSIEPLIQPSSIDIPLGSIHRLSNESNSQLIIIEIQFGDYLGEDDIIRYEDDFNRV